MWIWILYVGIIWKLIESLSKLLFRDLKKNLYLMCRVGGKTDEIHVWGPGDSRGSNNEYLVLAQS